MNTPLSCQSGCNAGLLAEPTCGCAVAAVWFGFPAQVRQMVLSCPAILAEKPLELQRKADFLKQVC